jgi:hypothetical protein
MSIRTSLWQRRGAGSHTAVEDPEPTTGARFFVKDTTGVDAAGYGKSPDKPFATIDYAVGKCTASKGDTIYVMPFHAENLSVAASLTLDVIGVNVVGLGRGRSRPQVSITGTAGTVNVSAANCSIRNIDIVSNVLNIVSAMTVTAGGLLLDGVNFYDTSVILGALIGISVAADCDDITIRNCNYYGIVLTAAAANVIIFAGGSDRLVVENCYFYGSFSDDVISASAAQSLDIILKDLLVYNLHATGLGITLEATTTGMATNVQAFIEAETPAVSGAALAMTNTVMQTNVITSYPYLCIAADS